MVEDERQKPEVASLACARTPPGLGRRAAAAAHDGAMAVNALNLQLVIKEYIIKMLNEAGVGMKCLVLDDFTVRHEPSRLERCPRFSNETRTDLETPVRAAEHRELRVHAD